MYLLCMFLLLMFLCVLCYLLALLICWKASRRFSVKSSPQVEADRSVACSTHQGGATSRVEPNSWLKALCF